MQAVIELTMTIVSAFAVAILAQFGVGADQPPKAPPRAERVVARSPQAKAPLAPRPAIECPEARAAASDVA